MRNVSKFLLVMLMMCNLSLISCADNSLVETEELYQQVLSTEGDDEDVIEEPDDD
ncbi:hypothetical protein [Aquimarina sp. 2201CG5-10]|uniref:hypothetical protein n=1 Tax=Aquimarina callyspongiae TaxID=3098150 RepID=UPI002AB44FC8|nr:hypothetical protein [Aquimarina sp. 2201CG5-10]MDY8134857.1 hypothetical protein [Aquimarina sp. 2201CG5-10]